MKATIALIAFGLVLATIDASPVAKPSCPNHPETLDADLIRTQRIDDPAETEAEHKDHEHHPGDGHDHSETAAQPNAVESTRKRRDVGTQEEPHDPNHEGHEAHEGHEGHEGHTHEGHEGHDHAHTENEPASRKKRDTEEHSNHEEESHDHDHDGHQPHAPHPPRSTHDEHETHEEHSHRRRRSDGTDDGHDHSVVHHKGDGHDHDHDDVAPAPPAPEPDQSNALDCAVRVCTMEWDPKCDQFGKKYSNTCDFEYEKRCETGKENIIAGPCADEPEPIAT